MGGRSGGTVGRRRRLCLALDADLNHRQFLASGEDVSCDRYSQKFIHNYICIVRYCNSLSVSLLLESIMFAMTPGVSSVLI